MRLLPLLATLACLGSPVHAEADRFRNPTAQFELRKPTDWVYLSAEQNTANLKAVGISDADLREAMVKHATVPMVVLAKHPEPFNDLNPSFKVNMRPLGQFAGQPPAAILTALLPALTRAFADATLVQAPLATKVGGLDAAYLRIDYMLRAGDAEYPTTSELWVVPRGDFFFLIGAGSRRDEATGSRREIAEILESIRFGP